MKKNHYNYIYYVPQLGSYFGYSVACGDFDGDGLDDLAVGAPWYTIHWGGGDGARGAASGEEGASDKAYENGMVATYAQTKQVN